MKGELIIHSLKEACSCCCLAENGCALLGSEKGVQLVDVLTGEVRGRLMYQLQLSPILIVRISQKKGEYLMQNKDGLVMIFQVTSSSIEILTTYRMDMMGFTKLAVPLHTYSPKGIISTSIP